MKHNSIKLNSRKYHLPNFWTNEALKFFWVSADKKVTVFRKLTESIPYFLLKMDRSDRMLLALQPRPVLFPKSIFSRVLICRDLWYSSMIMNCALVWLLLSILTLKSSINIRNRCFLYSRVYSSILMTALSVCCDPSLMTRMMCSTLYRRRERSWQLVQKYQVMILYSPKLWELVGCPEDRLLLARAGLTGCAMNGSSQALTEYSS